MKRLKIMIVVIAAMTSFNASAAIDVTYCRAHWWLTPDSTFIKGSVATYFKPTADEINAIDFDLVGHMRVDSVVSHNQHLAFNHSANKLSVTLPCVVAQGTTDSVVIHYHGKLKSTGLGSIGINHQTHTIWTISQPYGARDWWPCQQNLYDKIDSMDIFVTCPIEYKVATNGVIVSDMATGRKHTTHYRVRHPLNYYTIGVAVGDYIIKQGEAALSSGDTVPIYYYHWPTKNSGNMLSYMTDLLNVYSDYFMPYPYADEKYGQATISGGTNIEHQTMAFLAQPENAIMVAHELTHQWFGNYVTCGGWHNIWVNEGFATFGELLAIEKLFPEESEGWLNYTITNALQAKDSLVITDTTNPDRIFDVPTAYSKGAMVVVMLRDEIGEPAFRQGCQMILERFGNGFTTIDDARQCFEQAADTSLVDFFNRWIYCGGHPQFKVSYNNKQFGSTTIDIQQSAAKLKSTDPDFYPMHITVRLVGKNAQKDVRLHLTSPQQQFVVSTDFKVNNVIFDPNKVILGTWHLKKQGKK